MFYFTSDANIVKKSKSIFEDLPYAGEIVVKVDSKDYTIDEYKIYCTDEFYHAVVNGMVFIDNSGNVYEIIKKLDNNIIEYGNITNGEILESSDIICKSFEKIIDICHQEYLESIGIDFMTNDESVLDESNVISQSVSERIETIMALCKLYGGGIYSKLENNLEKLFIYTAEFNDLVQKSRILIDTDDDGFADMWCNVGARNEK